jgi:GDP-L-galactose phosphorylase
MYARLLTLLHLCKLYLIGSYSAIGLQCFAERLARGLIPDQVAATGVNPAVFEIAGHMLLKRQEDYDVLGEDELAVLEVLRCASLPEEKFLQVAQMCFGSIYAC